MYLPCCNELQVISILNDPNDFYLAFSSNNVWFEYHFLYESMRHCLCIYSIGPTNIYEKNETDLENVCNPF